MKFFLQYPKLKTYGKGLHAPIEWMSSSGISGAECFILYFKNISFLDWELLTPKLNSISYVHINLKKVLKSWIF